MEITKDRLNDIIATYPGDFAIYKLKNRKMQLLHYSKNLPMYSGMTDEEYKYIVNEDANNMILDLDYDYIMKYLDAGAADPEHTKDAEVTYRMKHKVKDFVWVRSAGRLIGTLDDCPVIMLVFRNLSEEVDEKLQILNNTASSIYVIDKNKYELLYANEIAVKDFKLTDMYGKKCHSIFFNSDTPCEQCLLNNIVSGRGIIEARYIPEKDSWYRYISHDISWYGHEAVVVYAMDITKRIREEKKQALNRRDLEITLNNIPVGTCVYEIKNNKIKVTALNEQTLKILGITGKEISTPYDLIKQVYPDDREYVIAELNKVTIPNIDIIYEYRFLRQNEKEYIWIRSEIRTVKYTNAIMAFQCISDITEEKKTKETEQKSRRMYEMALDLGNFSIWEYDFITRQSKMINKDKFAWDEKYYNFPEVIENMPDAYIQYLEEDSVSDYIGLYKNILNGGEKASAEIWYKMKNPLEQHCDRVSLSAIYDEYGNLVKALGLGQDITERKLEEENYKRWYRKVTLEGGKETITALMLNLTKNRCSSCISIYSGIKTTSKNCNVDQIFNKIIKYIVGESEREEVSKILDRKRMIADYYRGETDYTAEYNIKLNNNELQWQKGNINLLQNPVTEDIEAILRIEDITEHRELEKIITHITDRMFDYYGIINIKKEKLKLYQKEEFYNTKGKEISYDFWRETAVKKYIIPEEKNYYLRLTNAVNIISQLELNNECIYTFRCRDKNSTARIQLQYSWLNKEEGKVFLVRTDVTAAYIQEQERLKQIEAAALKARDAMHRAEAANRAKTDFVSRISHDIRTPLNIGISMTDFALEDIDNKDKLKADLSKIKSANTFLLSLINDVLDISKINSEKVEMRVEPYLYSEYVKNISNIIEPMCKEKNMEFIIDGTDDFNGIIVVDKIRINQVILNLLSNAVKYTKPGGRVSLVTKVKAIDDENAFCAFEISDNGIGMNDEFQEKMFDQFSQDLSNPERRNLDAGTGLGLSIVKNIIELLNGNIRVKSSIGKGTKVFFNFTTKYIKDTENIISKNESNNIIPESLSGKILLAEDNKINAEIAERILNNFGFDVDIVYDGEKEVEKFRNSYIGEYSAIVTDIQMPLLDGYEAASMIRSLERRDSKIIPIIAMTAYAHGEAVEKGIEAGMNGHITKPLNKKEIYAILKKVINYQI